MRVNNSSASKTEIFADHEDVPPPHQFRMTGIVRSNPRMTDMNAQPQTTTQITPDYIRLPKSGTQCPYTGLSRTTMFRLCEEGLVRSKTLRRPGQLRGVRLVCYDSLIAYLAGCSEETATAKGLAA